jgi:hypothetical protein
MVQIQRFSVGEDVLTVDYQVTNPFSYDIWICEDTLVFDPYHAAETRTTADSLTIRLRLDTEIHSFTEEVLAKYRRLSPKQSFSGTLILELPIRNFWALHGFRDLGKVREPVILHRAAFEVGYFEGDLLEMLSESVEEGHTILLELQSRQTESAAYIPPSWMGLLKQKSVRVFVNDIDIPCSVVADDE